MKDLTYSIETLEIELNKIKSTLRNLDVMQDEMRQKHPSIDSYIQKKKELEKTIKLLNGYIKYVRFDHLDISRNGDEFTITYTEKSGDVLSIANSVVIDDGDTLQIRNINGVLPIEFSSD